MSTGSHTLQNISAIMQSAAGATGVGVNLIVLGYSRLSVQVSGTFTGTVTFKGTTDGVNYLAIGMTSYADTTTVATTATAPGMFYAAVGGLIAVRAEITAYTDGAITVNGRAQTG